MKKIYEIVSSLKEVGHSNKEIADLCGVSVSMVSIWSNPENDYNPSYRIAKRIYMRTGIISWPFDERALK